jgi:hypothetical protein
MATGGNRQIKVARIFDARDREGATPGGVIADTLLYNPFGKTFPRTARRVPRNTKRLPAATASAKKFRLKSGAVAATRPSVVIPVW